MSQKFKDNSEVDKTFEHSKFRTFVVSLLLCGSVYLFLLAKLAKLCKLSPPSPSSWSSWCAKYIIESIQWRVSISERWLVVVEWVDWVYVELCTQTQNTHLHKPRPSQRRHRLPWWSSADGAM